MSENDSLLKKLANFIEYRKLGPLHTYLRVGGFALHRIAEPKVARGVLQSRNFVLPSFVKKGLGQVIPGAMILNEGEAHKKKFVLMKELFSPSGVNRVIAPMVVPATDKMIDRWHASGKPFDTEMDMRYHTGSTITRVMFSDSITETQARTIVDAATVEVNVAEPIPALTILSRVFEGVSRDTRLGRFLEAHRDDVNAPSAELDKGVRMTKAIFDDIIDDRRRLAKQPEDVLGLMIGAKYGHEEIKHELLEIVFAGHDTSSVTATMGLREMLKNPAEYEKLRREVDTVTGGRDLTPADFGNLTVADNVVKETLRLYPPAHRLARVALKKETIAGADFEEGDHARIGVDDMHHSPLLWDKPEAFMPDRFNAVARPLAWIPFSAGVHQCLGMGMASVVVPATLAHIAQRCDIEIVEDVRGIKKGFTERPKGSLLLKSSPRR